jgi:hypothetical protein
MKHSTFIPFLESQATETGCREVTFTGDFSKGNFQAGNILTVRDTYRDNSGGFINLSKNIHIENVKMHYMHGMGIVSQFSENISIVKVEVAPRPESGRQIAAFADCFHFSGCKGKIIIDSCFTSGSHDDPVNVHGTHLKITNISENGKLTVRFMHHQTYGFEAFFVGDSIAFIDPKTLQPVADAIVKSAKLINVREMELELEGPLPNSATIGQVIENITWTPEVQITNSHFEKTNTRGLLLTTRKKVLVENNTFYRTGMHAILIANDASSWFESGPVYDFTIRNNTFQECGYNQAPGNYIIAISPENHELVPGFMVHRNIRIENNTFKIYDFPVLTARSTEALIFENNKIIYMDFMELNANRPSFSLNACRKAVIKNNMVEGFSDLSVQLENMNKQEVKTDKEIKLNKN